MMYFRIYAIAVSCSKYWILLIYAGPHVHEFTRFWRHKLDRASPILRAWGQGTLGTGKNLTCPQSALTPTSM